MSEELEGTASPRPDAGDNTGLRVVVFNWDLANEALHASEAGDGARQRCWSRDALAIRIEVFVQEQRVPPEEEPDHLDPTARHVLCYDRATKAALGTGRLYLDAADSTCGHIGRMAVRAAGRGRGVGSAIMEALMSEARQMALRRMELSAQCHAIPFYERHGFIAEGDVYLDCDIPHRVMRRDL